MSSGICAHHPTHTDLISTYVTRTVLEGEGVAEYLDAPGVRDGLAGLEDQQVLADHEGVWAAGGSSSGP